jgi:hypothetical protein
MTHNETIINEAVEQFAGYFASILADQQVNKSARAAELFEQFSDYLKANVVTPENDTSQPLLENLEQIVTATGLPLKHFLHTAHGANLLERLSAVYHGHKHLSKNEKDEPVMNRSDEMSEMHKFVKSTPGGMTSIAKNILARAILP